MSMKIKTDKCKLYMEALFNINKHFVFLKYQLLADVSCVPSTFLKSAKLINYSTLQSLVLCLSLSLAFSLPLYGNEANPLFSGLLWGCSIKTLNKKLNSSTIFIES